MLRRFVLAAFAFFLLIMVAEEKVQAQTVPMADLMEQGPLPDMFLGAKEAKVVVIEYASLTCGHCAIFHETTFPAFRQRYIDTGKVRYALREFPLDPLATAGFLLARCQSETAFDGAREARYYAITDLLFAKQRQWAFVDKPVDALQSLVRQAGITGEAFESCLRDEKRLNAVNAIRQRASDKLSVTSTPTLIINGQIHKGAMSIEELSKILDPLVDGGSKQ
jgi:protein-disulfide isomerase